MNIFSLAKLGWGFLGSGRVMVNAVRGKQGQVAINAIAAFLAPLLLSLKGTKYDPHLDNETLLLIAGGIYGVANWLLTAATTDKIGVLGNAVPNVVGAPGGTAAPTGGTIDDATREAARLWAQHQASLPSGTDLQNGA